MKPTDYIYIGFISCFIMMGCITSTDKAAETSNALDTAFVRIEEPKKDDTVFVTPAQEYSAGGSPATTSTGPIKPEGATEFVEVCRGSSCTQNDVDTLWFDESGVLQHYIKCTEMFVCDDINCQNPTKEMHCERI